MGVRASPTEVEVNPSSKTLFSQVRVDGRFFAEYRFTDTIAANTTLQYDRS